MALTPATGAVVSLTPVPLTAVGSGPWVKKTTGNCAVQVIVQGTGAISAGIEVETSLGPSAAPLPIATSAANISLAGSNGFDSDGFIMKDAPWTYIRIRVTDIAGTAAAVTGLLGANMTVTTHEEITGNDVGGSSGGGGSGTGDLLSTNNLSDVASVGTSRANLGLAIGINVQGYSAQLAAFAALGTSANLLPYATGTATFSTTGLTAFARTLLDDADAATMRTTLGVGTGVGDMLLGTAQSVTANKSFAAGTLIAVSPAFTGTGTGSYVMPTTWTMASTPSAADNSLKVSTTAYADAAAAARQATLVSATNIKTINGSSLLGSGDLVVAGSGTVTATAGALSSNRLVLGAGSTDTKSAAGLSTDGVSQVVVGVAGSSVGTVKFNNASSGDITVGPPTGALGTIALTWPLISGTLAVGFGQVALTSTNTLTQASHFNRHLTWTGSSTAAQAISATATGGDYIEFTNDGTAKVTFTGITPKAGFKASAEPGETFYAVYSAGAWVSLTPHRVDTVPLTSASAAYTTVITDIGVHHPSADTTARTITIDSNANVPYPLYKTLTFVNEHSAGVMTIAITSDTMRLAGPGTTGSRTLAADGIATAIKLTTTSWIISGTGLT